MCRLYFSYVTRRALSIRLMFDNLLACINFQLKIRHFATLPMVSSIFVLFSLYSQLISNASWQLMSNSCNLLRNGAVVFWARLTPALSVMHIVIVCIFVPDVVVVWNTKVRRKKDLKVADKGKPMPAGALFVTAVPAILLHCHTVSMRIDSWLSRWTFSGRRIEQ